MVTDQDICMLGSEQRGGLVAYALKRLPRKCWDEAEDLVNQALLAIWMKRDQIRGDAKWYAFGVIGNLAMQRQQAKYQATMQSIPGNIRDESIDPLHALLEAEAEADRLTRRKEIIKQLPPWWRKKYREWERRGFRSETHGHFCTATRLRKKIAALSGAIMPKRMHVEHTKRNAVVLPPPAGPQ